MSATWSTRSATEIIRALLGLFAESPVEGFMETGNIWIEETFINKDKGYRFGDSGVYESFTDDKGKLFKSLQKEYGRCVSRVYVDQKEGPPKQIGWVFEKKMQYEDARNNKPESFYMREVWVSLYTGPETVTKTRAPYVEL